MAEETAQEYAGGDISVATVELNPEIHDVVFWKINEGPDIFKSPGSVISPDVDTFIATYGNVGDETIDVRYKLYLDDVLIVDSIEYNIAPGGTSRILTSTGLELDKFITIGEHKIAIELRARRASSGPFPTMPQDAGVATYFVYTAELNPVYSKVELKFTDGTIYPLISEGAAIPNVIVPAGLKLYTARLCSRNDGDEPLNAKWNYSDDVVTWVQLNTTDFPAGEEKCGSAGGAEIYPSGAHSFTATIYAARKGEPLPTTPTQTITGTFKAHTPELNPCMVQMILGSSVEWQLGRCQVVTGLGNDIGSIKDNIICKPTMVEQVFYQLGNRGDETLNVRAKIYLDDVLSRTDDFTIGIYTTGSGYAWIEDVDLLGCASIGKHVVKWELYAKRTTDTSYPTTPQVSDSVTYYVYTAPLDAIATTVKIVQGTNEYLWLIGTAEGFVASAPRIESNKVTSFKFELSNPGDEPIKMNVGHLVVDHYETGFLVGGVLFDTVDKNVEIAPGATGVINTAPFTITPPPAGQTGSVTIGPFSVRRVRHLI